LWAKIKYQIIVKSSFFTHGTWPSHCLGQFFYFSWQHLCLKELIFFYFDLLCPYWAISTSGFYHITNLKGFLPIFKLLPFAKIFIILFLNLDLISLELLSNWSFNILLLRACLLRNLIFRKLGEDVLTAYNVILSAYFQIMLSD
jgi:hypothetical protein